jgi:NitT/TauT family transport system substrate-binding protein
LATRSGRALNKAGVQAGVETVLLDFPEITAAFANGAIDLAIQPEPTASASVGRGVAVKWREVSDVVPGVQNTVVVFGSRLIDDQQEVGIRWVTAYLKGVRDYHAGILNNGTGRADVVSILTRWTPVADPTLYNTMGFPFIDPNGELSLESLADELRFFREQGQVTGPVEVDQVVESGFAAGAVQKLGRYQS